MNLADFLLQDADDFIHFTGHRVGLHQLVHYYNAGYSAEMLACQYPTLPLPLIHKAIAFYLENRDDVDAYAAACTADEQRQRAQPSNGPTLDELRKRLAERQR